MKTVVHFKAGPYLPITETWIYSQVKHLSLYRPVVYALEMMNLDIFPTERIRKLWFHNKHQTLSRLLLYTSFLLFIEKDRPNLIHAHFGPSGHGFLRIKQVTGIPLITTFYGYDLQRLVNQYPQWQENYKKLFLKGDLFLVEGPHMKECLRKLGCSEHKIVVQHLGIDMERICFLPRKLENNGEVSILVAGSFREKKGVPLAVQALGHLKLSYPELKLKLTIIGDSSGDRSEEKQKYLILKEIEQYGLRDSVRMLGYQPYEIFIQELYKHHIFLSPSLHASDGDTEGGAPVSIIEASASGMPVVSTLHCDIPEVIVHGVSGYLVPEKDVDALTLALYQVIAHPELWEKIGRKGREHTEKYYDVRRQAIYLENIYDTVIDAKKL